MNDREVGMYECPECGDEHIGDQTGTEWCPACTADGKAE